jgi:hypothetical protein
MTSVASGTFATHTSGRQSEISVPSRHRKAIRVWDDRIAAEKHNFYGDTILLSVLTAAVLFAVVATAPLLGWLAAPLFVGGAFVVFGFFLRAQYAYRRVQRFERNRQRCFDEFALLFRGLIWLRRHQRRIHGRKERFRQRDQTVGAVMEEPIRLLYEARELLDQRYFVISSLPSSSERELMHQELERIMSMMVQLGLITREVARHYVPQGDDN